MFLVIKCPVFGCSPTLQLIADNIFFRKKDVADTRSHPWAPTVSLATENVAFCFSRFFFFAITTGLTSAQTSKNSSNEIQIIFIDSVSLSQ